MVRNLSNQQSLFTLNKKLTWVIKVYKKMTEINSQLTIKVLIYLKIIIINSLTVSVTVGHYASLFIYLTVCLSNN